MISKKAREALLLAAWGAALLYVAITILGVDWVGRTLLAWAVSP